MEVCFVEDKDDFVEKQNIIWYAMLSNGKNIVRDDDRPGQNPPSSWLRLKKYISENNLKIIDFILSDKNNVKKQRMPENANGYFFAKTASAVAFTEETQEGVLVGYLENGAVRVFEIDNNLRLSEIESRTPEQAGFFLIKNGKTTNG